MALISEYHRVRVSQRGTETSLDDRTCADLHLDTVFARLDHTESAVGQQALYHRLRTAPVADHLDAFEELVHRLGRDDAMRERLQATLATLADPAAYHLCTLVSEDLRPRPWHAVFPVLAGIMVLSLASAAVWPLGLLVAICGVVVHLLVRISIAGETGAALALFGQLAPLLRAGTVAARQRIAGAEPILDPLIDALPRLRTLGLLARWAGRGPTGSDLVDGFFAYLNLVFLLDANGFYFGARELHRQADALLAVVGAVGEVDAAIAVASFRAGGGSWTRPQRTAPGTPVRLGSLRHPLLEDAVPNNIALAPPAGLLLTGANMSGKSTLLRTIGINVVLAQTIHTCLAASYQAPALRVRSLIGRADDLMAGKSYYLVEAESVVELLAAAAGETPHLFLLDELFRGTNTVERIAAGAAVLGRLAGDTSRPLSHIVIVATHDRELVDLLGDRYAPARLGDAIGPAGLTFDYQLRPGPATTRNAIALLRLTGAADALIDDAESLAAALDRDRRVVGDAP